LSLLKSRLTLVTILIALAIAGSYYSYNLGYDALSRSLEPEIKRLATANENLAEENNNLNNALNDATQLGVVKVGYIAPSLSDFELSGDFIHQIVEPDLNAYAAKLGYNVTFQFVISNANTQAAEHLKLTQDLKKQGIDLVISGGWSSMLSASRAYLNDRDMVMVGTTSTSPALTTPNTRLFRMITPESAIPNALVDIMWSYGVKSVVIIQRGDGWGDLIASIFRQAWMAKGGGLAGEAVRYSPEESNFTSSLKAANLQAEAAKRVYPDGDRVAVLLLSFDEDIAIVNGMETYTPLYDCVLFSVYSHIGSKSDGFLNNPRAEHLKVFTPAFQPFRSSKYESLKARYPSLDEFDAYLYDSAWAVVTSVLETRSVNASKISGVFPDVCGRLYGVSGWCNLDENGDRAALPMDVCFYRGSMLRAGVYDPDSGSMTWNKGELEYAPAGP
jgi:ABC-type branched-subunit amino acid transport system substrate-binding protein